MGFKKIRKGYFKCLLCGKNTNYPEVHICIGFSDEYLKRNNQKGGKK